MNRLCVNINRSYFLILLIVSAALCSNAQVSNHKAYTLFVYNFTKYVEWPDGAIKDEFVIGVFGKSPVIDELQKMVNVKKAGDKTMRIVLIENPISAADVHILFMPDQQSAQLQNVIAAVRGKPVLVVTERQGLTSKGATISFVSDHNSLKFELNNTAIAGQNLKVSKTLEALAFKGPS